MQNSIVVGSRVVSRSAPKSTFAAVFLLITVFALPSWAAMVPTNEAGMDIIFGSGNFGTDAIDIRFNSQIDIFDDTLFNIDDTSSWNALVNTTLGLASNVVRMFFVNDISLCNTGPAAGCATIGGNEIAIELEHSTRTFADELYAHELGHSLGLNHFVLPNNPTVDESNNLMLGTIRNGNGILFADQVADALIDPAGIIQVFGGERFIEITPILVNAAVVVPLPGALILCLSALGFFGLFAGRGHRAA